MTNKETINKLRDNAELAWAAYGFFHLANPNYDFDKDEIDKKRLEDFRDIKEDKTQSIFPTPSDILNLEYKYFKDEITGKLKDGFFDDRLFDGDFSPIQAQRLFERYDLLIHQPNTESGFSATLFKEKTTKQIINKSKEKSYNALYNYIT